MMYSAVQPNHKPTGRYAGAPRVLNQEKTKCVRSGAGVADFLFAVKISESRKKKVCPIGRG